MKRYIVKEAVTLTAQKGSAVILTDQQADAVKGFITDAKPKKQQGGDTGHDK